MSKHDQEFTPYSLAQHFEAPDDFVGCFGWVCGFSADVGFLDDAVERFVRRTHLQRAYEGRIAIALMLDPSYPQIAPKEVPGVLHLPIYGVRPFRLLHAKVALLGFRHMSDTGQWRLRLLVSTGNWTRQTLEDSLDLVWRIDLSDHDLKVREESLPHVCADMTSAWGMLDWLRNHFDTRAIHATPPDRPESDSSVANQRIETWLRAVNKAGDGVAPRFLDNRQSSFLAQLPALVRLHGSPVARNYLAMGSGFYESSDDDDRIPSALPRIDIEEAWGQLANFPMPPDEEELLSDGDAQWPEATGPDGKAGKVNSSYPLRQMMQLIENIAAKQTSVCQADWATWCTRLEQCLIQAAGNTVVEEFSNLQLNPFSPLRHAPFRPDFALTADTAEGTRYEEALRRVETAWNVAELNAMGEPA